MNTPVFRATGLGYAYGGRHPALEAVSLQVNAGERVALLGANGSGKSTLLKVLAGLVTPTSGRLFAFGTEVTEATLADEQFSRAFRSRVGVVFQNPDIQLFSPTVREEVAFGPLQLGMSQAQAGQRVGEVLAMLELTDMAERAPYQLSGGQKKKVALACVLAMNPEVLLVDEPTAALDPRSQAWLLETLDALHAAGKTLIMATHDLDSLERVAGRAVVLGEDHRVLADTTPAGLLADRHLLLGANLIHEHTHRHLRPDGVLTHTHPHGAAHHEPGGQGAPG